jgi:hypothetical protein
VNGKVFYGIKTGLNKAFVIDQATKDRLIAEDPRSTELIKPFAQGRDIKRYAPIPVKQYLILIPKGWTNQHRKGNAWNWFSSQYPAVASHLKQFEKEAIARADQGDYWWELRACDYYDEFEKPKIVWGNMSTTPNYTMDLGGTYINAPAVIIPLEDYYLLGIMNSSLGYYFISKTAAGRRGGFFEYKPIYVSQLPIHIVNETDPRGLEIKKQIEQYVRRILLLNSQEALIPSEKDKLRRTIDIVDAQINQLVLKLYRTSDLE